MSDRFRQGARKVDAGTFSLDEARAQEKLARFQLANPRRYVLEFVKAAHILGATTIDFRLERGELEVWFDAPFPETIDLEDLASAVFRRRLSPADEALRHLSVGYQAASSLRLRSFEARPEERNHLEGTAISLRERLRPGHLTAAFSQLLGQGLPEERILREYCAFATAEITVNGESIRREFGMPEEVDEVITFRSNNARGVMGIHPLFDERGLKSGGTTEVIIVHRGVRAHIATADHPFATGVGIVHADDLSFDLSQGEPIYDVAFDEIVNDVIPAAVLETINKLFQAVSPPVLRGLDAPVRELIEEVASDSGLRRSVLRSHAEVLGVSPRELIRHRIDRAEAEFRSIARTARIYPPAVLPPGGQGPYLTVDDAAHPDVDRLDFATSTFRLSESPSPTPILVRPGEPRQGLHWLAGHLVDATTGLRNQEVRERNINQWRRRRRAPEGLDPSTFSDQTTVEVQSLWVTVGRMHKGDRYNTFSSLRLIKEGRLLTELILMPGDIMGIGVQISGDFEADQRFVSTLPTRPVAAAALAASRLIPEVLLAGEPPHVVKRFVDDAPEAHSGIAHALNLDSIARQIRDAMLDGLADFLEENPVPGIDPDDLRSLHQPEAKLPKQPQPPPPPQPELTAPLQAALRSTSGNGRLRITTQDLPGDALCALTDDGALVLNTSQAIVAQALSSQDPRLLTFLASSALGRLAIPDDKSPGITDQALKALRDDLLTLTQ